MSPTLQASVPAAVEDTPAISELLNLRTNVALSELIEFYRPLMLSLVKKELEPSLRQKVDASDIVQDACQEVARRFPTIRAKQRWQFWSYLMITVRHKLEDARGDINSPKAELCIVRCHSRPAIVRRACHRPMSHLSSR